MAARLQGLLPEAAIEHIGSTSVPDLPAKDVVDLLVGVELTAVPIASHRLAEAGFDLEGELPHHSWLGYPNRDDRQFVIHVVEYRGRAWQRRLDFRDLLRRDSDARRRYLDVKIASAATSENWDVYTQSKSSVVTSLLETLATTGHESDA